MSETKGSVLRDSKGLPIDDRGWPVCEVVDYDSVAAAKARKVEEERGRLEREVIEAAKAYGRANRAVEDQMKTSDDAQSQDSVNAWQLLRDLESSWENLMLDSVDALLAFEAEQEGNKQINLMEDLEAERSRLEQIASEAQEQLIAAQKREDQAFRELIDFNSKHLRDEQVEFLGGR